MNQAYLQQIEWNEQGLVPAIAQDAGTGRILMMAWMNAEALALTVNEGVAVYWSRSRGKLWVKGESSGQIQKVVELRTDCDQDVILIKVDIGDGGAACHTGYKSCFYRKLDGDRLVHDGGRPLFDPAKVYRS